MVTVRYFISRGELSVAFTLRLTLILFEYSAATPAELRIQEAVGMTVYKNVS